MDKRGSSVFILGMQCDPVMNSLINNPIVGKSIGRNEDEIQVRWPVSAHLECSEKFVLNAPFSTIIDFPWCL